MSKTSKADRPAKHAAAAVKLPRPVMWRSTFSLPPDLSTNLVKLSKRLGVSQSSIVVELLSEPLASIVAILDDLPPAPSPEDVKRARGRSLKLIEDVMHEATTLAIQEARK